MQNNAKSTLPQLDRATRAKFRALMMGDQTLTATAKVIGFWILENYNERKRYAWPSYVTLHLNSGESRSSVARAVKLLLEQDWFRHHEILWKGKVQSGYSPHETRLAQVREIDDYNAAKAAESENVVHLRTREPIRNRRRSA